MALTENIGEATLDGLAYVGGLARLGASAAHALIKDVLERRRLAYGRAVRQAMAVGIGSLPILSLITFFIGTILALQSAYELRKFGAMQFVADAVAISVSRELGPLITAILVIGRSGSSFAAELGTMKVNEEINALETMGLSPVKFLVIQRVVAGILLTPVLTVFAIYAGLLGGIPVLLGLGFPLRMVLLQIQTSLHFGDIAEGLSKSVAFGAIVASVSCLRGLQTGEGPRAVGESTTRSVVSSILLIIFADAIFAAITYNLRK